MTEKEKLEKGFPDCKKDLSKCQIKVIKKSGLSEEELLRLDQGELGD